MIRPLQLILFSAFIFALSGRYIFFTEPTGLRRPTSDKNEYLNFLYFKNFNKVKSLQVLNEDQLDIERIIKEFDRPYLSPQQSLYYLSVANKNRSLKNYLEDYDDQNKAFVQPLIVKDLNKFKINPKIEPILYQGLLNEMSESTDFSLLKYYTIQGLSKQNLRIIRPYRPFSENDGTSPIASKLSQLDLKEWKKLNLEFVPQKIGLTQIESKYPKAISPLNVISIDLQKIPPTKGVIGLNISYGELKKDQFNLRKELGLPLNFHDKSIPMIFLGSREDYKVLYLIKRVSLTLIKDKKNKYQLIFNPEKTIISTYEYKELSSPKNIIAFVKDGFSCDSELISTKSFIPRSSQFLCWKKVKTKVDQSWAKLLLNEVALTLTYL